MINKVQLQSGLVTLTLHDLSDSTNKYGLETPIKGLEMPNIRTSSFQKSGQNGIFVTNQFLGERRIQLTGTLFRTLGMADFILERQRFLSFMAPSKTNSILNKKYLILYADNDKTYRLAVQILGSQMEISENDFARFSIDIIGIDDAILSATEKTYTLEVPLAGGVVMPTLVPATLSAGDGGILSAVNDGDTETYPNIRLVGPLTNPKIENRTSGKYIELNFDIVDGQYIDINMFDKTIIQKGDINRVGKKTNNSRFWNLQVGGNTIVLTTDEKNDEGYAVITYRDAWIGL